MKTKIIFLITLMILSLSATAIAQYDSNVDEPRSEVPYFRAQAVTGWSLDFETLSKATPFLLYFGEISNPQFQEDLISLQDVFLDYVPQFNIIVLSIDGADKIDSIKEFVNENNITFIVIPDPDKEITQKYKVETYPYIVFVQKYGKLLGTQAGYAKENFDKVVNLFNLKLPETADEYVKRGYYLYDQMNELERAQADFTRALNLESDNSKALCGIGEIHAEMNDYDKAAEYLNKAIELDKTNSRAWYNRAFIEESQRNFDKAMQYYIEGLAHNEEDRILTNLKNRLENKLKLVNKPAPDFTIETIDGKTFELSSYKGNMPVIIDMWATWCPPCQRLMPELQKFYDKHRDKAEIIAISAEKDGDAIPPYINERGYTFNVAYDPDRLVYDKYPTTGIPYLIVIDKNGIVIDTFVGFHPDIVEKLEKLLNIH